MSLLSLVSKRLKLQEELQYYESKTAECEELIRLMAKALDLVPITMIGKGSTWMPSDEAMKTIEYAKDRLTEWRVTKNGS